MRQRLYNGCMLALAVGWLAGSTPAVAQTNQPAPPPAAAESARFFEGYARAVQLVRDKHSQDAAITMDLLAKQLRTSPWMEIALLKHSELIEASAGKLALEDYAVLRSRLENAPYFQGPAEHARLFRVALQGAIDNGINRIRIRRIRDALSRYFARYSEYPESLMKLSILGYIDMENIQDAAGRAFHYTPTGQQLNPFISYKRYEPFSVPPAEPFFVNSPVVEGTSEVSSAPLKYAALIKMPENKDALRVQEDQTLFGFFVATVAREGAVLCTPNRILILPVTVPGR